MNGELQSGRIGRWALNLLGVLTLMWPALINGQPFFFSDTTAYVRAADLAVQLASRHHIRTAWSRADAPSSAGITTPPASASSAAPTTVHASDAQGGGSAMAGRSPYFGLLLYIGWVTSSFWLFLLAQALVAWWLIGLSLRIVGNHAIVTRLAIAVTLAALSPLAVYNSFLLADALAGFGILSFLLLVRSPPDLVRWERAALVLLLLISAAAHFTHIVILAGMTALLGLLALLRAVQWRSVRNPVLIGAGITVAGLISVMVTSFVIAHALGRPPAAAPVLTARFIVDGPGRAFARSGCGGRAFAACSRPLDTPDTDLWLWSTDPKIGGFVSADAATRNRLSAEDSRFARAVLLAYPFWQTGMMAWNTWDQMTRFDLRILNERCFADHACSGVDIPDGIRAHMVRTPGGRNLWPMGPLSMVHRMSTVAALALLIVALVVLYRKQPDMARLFLLWIGLTLAAFLINDFLGGAISNPQTRYQERIIWILPLLAMLAAIRAFQRPPETARPLE